MPVYSCFSEQEYARICTHFRGWVDRCRFFNICTAYCIWSVVSSISKLIRSSSSSRLFWHFPLKRDQLERDWRMRLIIIPNTISCNVRVYFCSFYLPLSARPLPTPPHFSFSVATSLYAYDSEYAECSEGITYTNHIPVYLNESCL